MNRKNKEKSTNISRQKLFLLRYFKGKPKSNKSLTTEEDLLYDCAVSCSLLTKAENLKMTNLDYSGPKKLWHRVLHDCRTWGRLFHI